MKKLSLIVIFCLTFGTIQGQARDFTSNAEGTTTANFLKLGVGARAIAMGEAVTAVTDDANALYWNPAGLVRIDHAAATFMHAAYLGNTFYDYAAYGTRLGEHGALGAGIQYFSAGRITETDVTGSDIGDFTPYDLATSLAYAYEMDGYSLGVTGKFIKSKIINSASTGAADIGFLTRPYLDDRLRLAATAVNLGGKMKFDQESDRLPLALRLGSSYKITERWLSSFDLGFPIDNNPYVAVGTEYRWFAASDWPVATRAGYNSLTTGDINGFTGFSFGFGTEHHGVGVDYAVVPFGSIGLAHRISLNVKFGASDSSNVLHSR